MSIKSIYIFLFCLFAFSSAVLNINVSPIVKGSKNIILDISMPDKDVKIHSDDRLTVRVSRVKISSETYGSADIYTVNEKVPISKYFRTTVKSNQINTKLNFPDVSDNSSITSRSVKFLLQLDEKIDTENIDFSVTLTSHNNPNNSHYVRSRQHVNSPLAKLSKTKFELKKIGDSEDKRSFEISLNQVSVETNVLSIKLLNTHYNFINNAKANTKPECSVNDGKYPITSIQTTPSSLIFNFDTKIPKSTDVRITCSPSDIYFKSNTEDAFTKAMGVTISNSETNDINSSHFIIGVFEGEVKYSLFIAGIVILSCIVAIIIVLAVFLFTQHKKRVNRLRNLSNKEYYPIDSQGRTIQ